MPQFYFCDKCNRKYKRADKLVAHQSKVHGVENAPVPEAKEYESKKTLYERVSGKTPDEVLAQKQKEKAAREEKNRQDIARIEKEIERQVQRNETGHATAYSYLGNRVSVEPALGKVRTHFTKQGFKIERYMDMVGCGYPSDMYDICDCTMCREGYSVPMWRISWA
jgi:hypothetical protein